MAERCQPQAPYDSPRRRSRPRRPGAQILDAAQRLFERQGYAATTMAAIAAEAGVALKTVYLAFETKSGVLRALWNLPSAATTTTSRSPSRRGTARSSRSPTPSASSASTRATRALVKVRIARGRRGDPHRRAPPIRRSRRSGLASRATSTRTSARSSRASPRRTRSRSTSTARPTSSGRSTTRTRGSCSSASAAGRPTSTSSGPPTRARRELLGRPTRERMPGALARLGRRWTWSASSRLSAWQRW